MSGYPSAREIKAMRALVRQLDICLARHEIALLNKLLDGDMRFRRRLPADLALFSAYISQVAEHRCPKEWEANSTRARPAPRKSRVTAT